MTYYPVVVQVIPAANRSIYVYFSNGHIRLFDMDPLIATGGIFSRLSDEAFFRERLTVMNGTAAWDLSGQHDPTNCIDLDPFTLYEAAAVADPLEKSSDSHSKSA